MYIFQSQKLYRDAYLTGMQIC